MTGILKLARVVGLFICLLGALDSKAAPPANDNFANRFSLTNFLFAIGTNTFFLTNTVNAHNQNATKELGEPNHAGNSGGHSVWWQWKSPVTATVTLDTIGSSFDTLLAVYTGTS